MDAHLRRPFPIHGESVGEHIWARRIAWMHIEELFRTERIEPLEHPPHARDLARAPDPPTDPWGVAVLGDELQDYACNVFCSPPVHCEVVLTGARDVITATLSEHRLARQRWAAEIGEAYARRCGVEIVRVLPGVDAPGDVDPRLRMSLLGGSTDEERRLVWWREKEDTKDRTTRHHTDAER